MQFSAYPALRSITLSQHSDTHCLLRPEMLAASACHLSGLSRLTLQLGGLRNQAALPALAQLTTLTALHLLEPPREDKWVAGQGFSRPTPPSVHAGSANWGDGMDASFLGSASSSSTTSASVVLNLSALAPLAPRLRELVLGPQQHPDSLHHLASLTGLQRLELRGGCHPGSDTRSLLPLSALRNLTKLVLLQPNPQLLHMYTYFLRLPGGEQHGDRWEGPVASARAVAAIALPRGWRSLAQGVEEEEEVGGDGGGEPAPEPLHWVPPQYVGFPHHRVGLHFPHGVPQHLRGPGVPRYMPPQLPLVEGCRYDQRLT